MESIKTVIFDLGRVLVDVHVERLAGFFRRHDATCDIQQTLSRVMTEPVMAQFNTGQLDPQAFYRAMCRRLGQRLSFDEFVLRWCDIFSPMAGMEEVVAALAGTVRLGLLSNTDPLHWHHIQTQYPLIRYFPAVTLSFKVGVLKPHRMIYLKAAHDNESIPAECLFIDDLQENVDAAAMTGMKAIRFVGVHPLRMELNRAGLL